MNNVHNILRIGEWMDAEASVDGYMYPPHVLSAKLQQLFPNTMYRVQISAVNAFGEGEKQEMLMRTPGLLIS
jgi:hypothetical protein